MTSEKDDKPIKAKAAPKSKATPKTKVAPTGKVSAKSKAATEGKAAAKTETATAGTPTPVSAPEVTQAKPAPANKLDPENTLIIETTKGRVVIAMRPDLAPGHVERIKILARQKFYDGIVFHRVIEGFMAQTGCPHGSGMGGSDMPDLRAEFNMEPHVRGVCSMARSSFPHSANSQFFICFADARFLDRQYTVWGKVVEGMENVDQIKRGEPVRDPDRMLTMRVMADVA